MSVLKKLTEGIVQRNVSKEGAAILNKWEKTGLLEGLGDERKKNTMAVLLENQAKELLREASSMQAGDVEGFAAVAFPIVRRVFGGLIANDLVSVQPMSLPSGLIFFLDFVHSPGGTNQIRPGDSESVYGGLDRGADTPAVGKDIVSGIDLVDSIGRGPGGFYNLGNSGRTSATGSVFFTVEDGVGSGDNLPTSVGVMVGGDFTKANLTGSKSGQGRILLDKSITEAQKAALRYDPDLLALGTTTLASGSATHWATTVTVPKSAINAKLTGSAAAKALSADYDNLTAFSASVGGISGVNMKHIRRLTRVHPHNNGIVLMTFVSKIADHLHGVFANAADSTGVGHGCNFLTGGLGVNLPIRDTLKTGGAIGSIVGDQLWGLEGAGNGDSGGVNMRNNKIPEIDIKVDSIAVTAQTKKLKAKWTPELGQDLNAYHNLDAEVELTGILSEQIALEIDQEILNDLVHGATAGTYYWARSPGLFVHRTTGAEVGASSAAPDFTGTVSEWYETLVETINDVSAQIHRKTLRGGANFLVTSPEVANILEFTSGFRASVTADGDRGTVGALKSGSLSKKWDVYVDPYFPRNVVLVGRKGGSFLESGYVYAPYVPLQVTPTIFGQEDFVPRKGVMTRYAKKMVRPDMYGIVIVRGILGEAGATS